MGRSVDYLTGATKVVYKDVSDFDDDGFEWGFYVENIQEVLSSRFKSLTEYENHWDGNETRIILENSFVEVGISEYCGLASISVRIHQDIDEQQRGLAERFIGGVELAIEQFGDLRKVATFSNGEGVYESIQARKG